MRIAARAVQVAHQADPSAQVTIGVDRPWAEWMGAATSSSDRCIFAITCCAQTSASPGSGLRSPRGIPAQEATCATCSSSPSSWIFTLF